MTLLPVTGTSARAALLLSCLAHALECSELDAYLTNVGQLDGAQPLWGAREIPAFILRAASVNCRD
jgi:hypothetical protein